MREREKIGVEIRKYSRLLFDWNRFRAAGSSEICIADLFILSSLSEKEKADWTITEGRLEDHVLDQLEQLTSIVCLFGQILRQSNRGPLTQVSKMSAADVRFTFYLIHLLIAHTWTEPPNSCCICNNWYKAPGLPRRFTRCFVSVVASGVSDIYVGYTLLSGQRWRTYIFGEVMAMAGDMLAWRWRRCLFKWSGWGNPAGQASRQSAGGADK